jgi:aryl-alcohol dehydrogenase-like predicted oxidoreductase
MDQIILGRTGLRVSRMGLGGGGHSRLGVRDGNADSDSVAIVRRALELGVNFIDTAEGYGTEEVVGQGIRGVRRDRIVISTKKAISPERPISSADLRRGLEQSLRRLGTDYIDVYHLHGLRPALYEHAVRELVPEMLKLKDQGKLRAVGVSEAFNSDCGHEMLRRAVSDDCWDVMMIGFNILNQTARDRGLAAARRKNVGVLCMFAVRAALSRPERLQQLVRELIDTGKLDRQLFDDVNDPLGFLIRDGVATNLTEAAYRFCRDEVGIHVVLSGTGNLAHLEQNVAAMQRPALPAEVRARLVRMFEGLDALSGE